jgi:iron complex outermembrane receptor protein
MSGIVHRLSVSSIGVFIVCLSPVSGAAVLEEVVVTAQKREQTLQDVSAAVSVVGMDRLQSGQIHNLEDLAVIVPSIYLGNDFNMAKLFIRGVGANTSTTGSETGVAVHLDGAVIARAEAQLTSLFDLERVEVLRGPHGTLYGRNAVGGSINLITAKPTEELSGYGRFTAGDYTYLGFEGALSGPIFGNQLLGRVAVKTEDRDGFGKNNVTGNDVDDLDRKMVRAQLHWLPTDAIDVLLSGEYYMQNDSSRALKFRRDAFPTVPRLTAGGCWPPPPGVGCTYADKRRDLDSEVQPESEAETWSITGTTTWRLNDEITLVNITNYREHDGFITQDLDLAGVTSSLASNGFNTTVQRRDVSNSQHSTEFQFKYDNRDWLNGVAGFFYFDERQRPVDTVGLNALFGQPHILPLLADPSIGAFPPVSATGLQIDGVNVPAVPIDPMAAAALCNTAEHTNVDPANPPAPKRVCIHSDLGTNVWALYGQANLSFGQFTLKLGARYSEEERTSSNPSIIIARNGLGPVLLTTTDGTYNERTFRSFDPEVGFEWRATDDLLFYYTYSQAFKAGAGENAAPGAATGFVSIIVEPEQIRNQEFGAKSTWFNNRLAVNVAGYMYDLEGQQINKTLSGGPAGFSTIFENAAQTSAWGFEVDFTAVISEQFRMSGGFSYLNSRYDDFETVDPLDPRNVATGPVADGNPLTDFAPQPNVQLAGNFTRNSPEWTAALHAEYDFHTNAMPGGGYFTLMGDLAYRDDVFFTEFNRFVEGQKAYVLADLNLRYTSGNDHWTADLWVKNLTDETVASSTFQLATARVIGVTYLPPRTFGFTLGYRF